MGQSDHWRYNPVLPLTIKPDMSGWLLEYRCVDEIGEVPEAHFNDPSRKLLNLRLEDHHTIIQSRRPRKLMWEPFVTCVVRNYGEKMGVYPEREKVNAADFGLKHRAADVFTYYLTVLLYHPSRQQWANDIKASYRELFMARRGRKLYRVGWLKEVAKLWGKELI